MMTTPARRRLLLSKGKVWGKHDDLDGDGAFNGESKLEFSYALSAPTASRFILSQAGVPSGTPCHAQASSGGLANQQVTISWW